MSLSKKRLIARFKNTGYWPRFLGALLLCVAIAGVRVSMTGNAGDAYTAGTAMEAKAAPAKVGSTNESRELPTSFAVSIRKPSGPPRVVTGLTDSHGAQVTVACSACHTARKPDFTNKVVGDLTEFHGELKFSHGDVSCLSCHNSNDYDSLKLADGARVDYADVMTLCAQCHGPQMKDYNHGAHGGMNGFWDLSRGPRTKNNCVDCHHPHAPQFPKMRPTFKPKDRFLKK